jgi:hypothetical protein
MAALSRARREMKDGRQLFAKYAHLGPPYIWYRDAMRGIKNVGYRMRQAERQNEA